LLSCCVTNPLSVRVVGRSVLSDFRGAVERQQASQHDQHSSRGELDPHARHRHHEHDRKLHLPVSQEKVRRLLAVHVRRTHQVQAHQGHCRPCVLPVFH